MHTRVLTFLIFGVALLGTAQAADSEQPVNAMWKVQRIDFPYQAFTVAYECRSLEDKVARILKTLGAHSDTRVTATGCEFDRVSRSLFLRVTTATPVEVTPEYKEELAKDKSRQELIARFGGKNRIDMDEFPAVWKRIELSRDRKLDLAPGDCELLETLRDRVFPKLSIKVVEDSVRCTPNQLGFTTPTLTVDALVRAPSPDEKQPDETR
jgi:hypothetical protein